MNLPKLDSNGGKYMPLISIIMSVRNCESTIEEALDSIFQQTYDNWELVICDDASTDRTLSIIKKKLSTISPDKYKILTNEQNLRLAASLNRCLEVASGELIARMDGDDLSVSSRFERQINYLLSNPHVDMVGTAMQRFNSEGLGEILPPASLHPDRFTLGKGSRPPFAHATIMAHKRVFDLVGKYTVDAYTARAEDLDLWFKFYAANLIGHNLPEALYQVREDAAAIRRRTPKSRFDAFVIRIRGNRRLNYSLFLYWPAIFEFIKIFVPYKIFDLHRAWSRSRAINSDAH